MNKPKNQLIVALDVDTLAEARSLVDNLWDSDFQEVPAVPAARRQISIGAAYRW